jgi:hypothetical protein
MTAPISDWPLSGCRVPPTPPSGRCSLSRADLAGRGGQVTINPAHVGTVSCLDRTAVIRALDRLSARGLLRREGRTVVLTAAHRLSGDRT